MTVPIDTWGEWIMLSLYCCFDTLFHSFGHDAMTPWLTNTIADPQVIHLPYSKRTCFFLIEVYYAYLHLSYMFKFFLSFTQVDFVIITTVSDMLMKIYSCGAYMEHKVYLPPQDSISCCNNVISIEDEVKGGAGDTEMLIMDNKKKHKDSNEEPNEIV